MQLFLFAGLLLCVYLGVLFGLNKWIIKQPPKQLQYRLSAGVGAFLMGGLMLGLAGSNIILRSPSLSLYTWIIGVFFGLLYTAARFGMGKAKVVWMPLACAAGVYILHKALPQIEMDLFNACVMFLSWWGSMSIVMFFDRLPLLNFLTLGTWTLALITMTLISSFIPPQMAVMSVLLLVPVWAIINNLSRRMEGMLGLYGITLTGFIMGGIIAACVGMNSYGSAIALMSYYLFEGIWFVLAWLGWHPLGMEKGMFAFGTVLAKENTGAVVKLIFYRLLTLSLLGVLMWQSRRVDILLVLIFIIFLDTYMRFKTSKPAPTIRDMWASTKNDLKKLWNQYRHGKESQSKANVSERPVRARKPVVKKKVVAKKKTIKRKKKK